MVPQVSWYTNRCPDSELFTWVPGRTPVVINTSQLAIISAAAKACTFHLVAFATETGPQTYLSNGRQVVGAVDRARWRGVVSCNYSYIYSAVALEDWHSGWM